jgi:hypothetical protein
VYSIEKIDGQIDSQIDHIKRDIINYTPTIITYSYSYSYKIVLCISYIAMNGGRSKENTETWLLGFLRTKMFQNLEVEMKS